MATKTYLIKEVMGYLDYKGMEDGDAVLMANFRADRAREISHAILDEDFNKLSSFIRKTKDKSLKAAISRCRDLAIKNNLTLGLFFRFLL